MTVRMRAVVGNSLIYGAIATAFFSTASPASSLDVPTSQKLVNAEKEAENTRVAEMLDRFPGSHIATKTPTRLSKVANGQYFEIRLPQGRIISALAQAKPSAPIAYAVRGELLATLKQNTSVSSLKAMLKVSGLGYSVARQVSRRGVYLLRTTNTGVDPWTAARVMQESGFFMAIEPNQVLTLNGNQHGISIPMEQWSLDTQGLANDGEVDGDVDGLEVLSRLKYGALPLAEVIVAIIDTGASVDHPALKSHLWTNTGEVVGNGRDDDGNGKIDDLHGWNFVGKNANVTDNNSHGTHVAGIIGATQHKPGVAMGLAPNAKLMILKVMEQSDGDLDLVVSAIDYAVENHARIINMSLGGRFYSTALQNAITNAADHDVITIAAAGNAERNTPPLDISIAGNETYPCRLANITLCVSATNRDGTRAAYSNYSSNPWTVFLFAAPGTEIWSTVAGTQSGYDRMSGTSMAAPHVTAVAAVVRGLNGGMDRYGVSRQLLATAEAGTRLNFYRAIATQRVPEEDDPNSYCNTPVEGTPRKWIAPFASSWESIFDGSTVERSHRLCTLQQLFSMNTLLGQQKHFALVRDLDWSDIDEPMRTRIGSEAQPFVGIFHGANHTLKNYVYELPLNDLGLFAKIGPRGRVSDFRMTNVRLKARDNVGALAGINEGVIENVQIEGVVMGANRVGGVVGVVQRAIGGPENSGRMTNVFFEGRVSGTGTVGGIAGMALNDAAIGGSFAKGLVNASGTTVGAIRAPAGGGGRRGKPPRQDKQEFGVGESGCR